MWGSIFNPENTFFRFCGKLTDVLVLSLFWVLCCVPIVTIGPATVALYYAAAKCIRRNERGAFSNFLSCFKENFKVSVLPGVLTAALLFLYDCGYAVMYTMARTGDRAAGLLFVAFCVMGLVLLGLAGYLFPIISRFPVTAGTALARTWQLAVRHLPFTLAVAVILFAASELVRFSPLFLFVLPAMTAYFCSFPMDHVLKQYVPAEVRSAAEELPVEERPWYLR